MIAVVTVLFGLMVAAPAEAPERLRARAALALALAADDAPPYAEQYRRALRRGEPLVVWVGQPARPVAGCVVMACGEFAGVRAPGVVVGVPDGGTLRRHDLPGTPDPAAVRAVAAAGR